MSVFILFITKQPHWGNQAYFINFDVEKTHFKSFVKVKAQSKIQNVSWYEVC